MWIGGNGYEGGASRREGKRKGRERMTGDEE